MNNTMSKFEISIMEIYSFQALPINWISFQHDPETINYVSVWVLFELWEYK